MDSSSISTQSSLDREGIKIDKDKEETKAKLELEPALPAKVSLDPDKTRRFCYWRVRLV